jgi:hypothetical protein
MYVYKDLKVLVISNDGWSWALAWRQLGVLIVSFYPLQELASKQLLEISRNVPGLIKAQGLDSQTIIVSGHIGSFTDHWKEFLTNLEHQLSQCIILSVIRQSSISVTTELTRICQGRIHVQELRHSCLGRLTSFSEGLGRSNVHLLVRIRYDSLASDTPQDKLVPRHSTFVYQSKEESQALTIYAN